MPSFLAWKSCAVGWMQEVQHVLTLLCELANHQMTWRRTLPDSVAEFEEMSLHLLAYIAREGSVRSGVYHSSHLGIRCHPVQKEEIVAHARPSFVGSSAGWFGVCARGCTVREMNGTASPSPKITPMVGSPLRTGSSSPGFGLVTSGSSAASLPTAICTEYSDLVAINVYRLVLLLLKFSCKQVQHAVDRFENGGTNDYGHFPQLPAPEVLYPLQVYYAGPALVSLNICPDSLVIVHVCKLGQQPMLLLYMHLH